MIIKVDKHYLTSDFSLAENIEDAEIFKIHNFNQDEGIFNLFFSSYHYICWDDNTISILETNIKNSNSIETFKFCSFAIKSGEDNSDKRVRFRIGINKKCLQFKHPTRNIWYNILIKSKHIFSSIYLMYVSTSKYSKVKFIENIPLEERLKPITRKLELKTNWFYSIFEK